MIDLEGFDKDNDDSKTFIRGFGGWKYHQSVPCS